MGTCSQSTTESKVSIDTYQCTCTPGYSNGWCEYDYISEGTANCTVFESDDSKTLSGNCDVDVNECASKPCKNGATCSQSTTESKVSIDTYQCTCKPGYSNGWCEYDYISEVTASCTVFESDDSKTLSGNCDVDVNECASKPCKNGATCSQSTTESQVSIDTYQCTKGCANPYT